MHAVPSFVVEPVTVRFRGLIPPITDDDRRGCHRAPSDDCIVFDRLVQVLVLGPAHERIADTGSAAPTFARRRAELVSAGILTNLERFCPHGYEKPISHLLRTRSMSMISRGPLPR